MIARGRILALFCMFIFSVFVGVAFSEEVETIKLVIGKSEIIKDIPVSLKRVSLGDPTIADIRVLRQKKPAELYIRGIGPGVTNIILWRSDGNYYKTFDLHISVDIAQLKRKLKEVLPDEDIKVEAAGLCVILSGEVSSIANMSIAIQLAESFVTGFSKKETAKTEQGVEEEKKGGKVGEGSRRLQVTVEPKVINLMNVAGVQQVMLEVRVAEMGRKLMRKIGINFSYFSPDFQISYLNDLTKGSNVIFKYFSGSKSLTGLIDALKTEGMIKILAKPTLVTMSGQEAKFLAGGEFPVPVPSGWGEIAIEWKQYGVELQFTPRVLSNDKINISVLPCVSELDYEHAVQLLGFIVPALTSRHASTTIELDDGQSFAIAGLLKEDIYEDIERFPLLGDIPILGALFRSSEFKKRETELVIIVTPHLVKPLDMAKQTLPTDGYVEPDDFDFYVMGIIEGVPKEEKSPAFCENEGFEGEFGHIAP